jgi:hypothetical protein
VKSILLSTTAQLPCLREPACSRKLLKEVGATLRKNSMSRLTASDISMLIFLLGGSLVFLEPEFRRTPTSGNRVAVRFSVFFKREQRVVDAVL